MQYYYGDYVYARRNEACAEQYSWGLAQGWYMLFSMYHGTRATAGYEVAYN